MCNAALCRHGFAPSLEQVTCSFEPPPPRSLSGEKKQKKNPPFCHLPIGYRCDFPIWKHGSGGSRWRRYPLIRRFAFWPRFGNKTRFYESEYLFAPAVFSCLRSGSGILWHFLGARVLGSQGRDGSLRRWKMHASSLTQIRVCMLYSPINK